MKDYERYTDAEFNEIDELLKNLYNHSAYWGTDIDTGVDNMEEAALRLAEIIRQSQDRREPSKWKRFLAKDMSKLGTTQRGTQ